MEWFRGGRCALIIATFFVCATAAQASTIVDTDHVSTSATGVEERGLLERAHLNEITAVPEPGAMMLVGTGLLLASRCWRKTS